MVAGGRGYENAVWAYPEPIESVPELADYVAFYWNQADNWYEEDDEVYKHPRDPYNRVDVLNSSRHVQVRSAAWSSPRAGGRGCCSRPACRSATTCPSSTSGSTCWPSRPAAAARTRARPLLVGPDRRRARRRTSCGATRRPIPETPKIENLLAFYNEKIDIIVDGIAQERPATKWS